MKPTQLATGTSVPITALLAAILPWAPIGGKIGTKLSAAGAGFNNRGKKTLAHPDYYLIQSWWHPTKNLGKLLGDFTHKCRQTIWLRCQAANTNAAGITNGRLGWQA